LSFLLSFPDRLVCPYDKPAFYHVHYIGDDVAILLQKLWVLGVYRDPRAFIFHPSNLSFCWNAI
jgi:hypothetical protein